MVQHDDYRCISILLPFRANVTLIFFYAYCNNADDVIVKLGEASGNTNGKLLIELLQNCNLVICNGRTMLNDPQWT